MTDKEYKSYCHELLELLHAEAVSYQDTGQESHMLNMKYYIGQLTGAVMCANFSPSYRAKLLNSINILAPTDIVRKGFVGRYMNSIQRCCLEYEKGGLSLCR